MFFSTTSNDYFYFKKNKHSSNNNFPNRTSQKSVTQIACNGGKKA